jgi:hypothetical protein
MPVNAGGKSGNGGSVVVDDIEVEVAGVDVVDVVNVVDVDVVFES